MTKLTIAPFGGMGEIGVNCTVVRYDDCAVVVDCGLRFPKTDTYGIDFGVPDFSGMEKVCGKKPDALLVTHAHEDHVGGIRNFLMEFPDVPVYASGFALDFIKERLDESGISTRLVEIIPGSRHRVVPGMNATFMEVEHSIPESMAIGLTTRFGKILFTGDFKTGSGKGRLKKISEFAGRSGVDILLTDSTGAEREGFCGHEERPAAGILEAMRSAKGRVVVSTFSSHLPRMQSVFDAAKKCGRKVAVAGRSIERMLDIGKKRGIVKDHGVLTSLRDSEGIPPEKLVLVATGSQGEHLAVLNRMANDAHPFLSIGEGDTVILSSRAIPGNEKDIIVMVNKLAKRGVTVVRGDAVHCSGHGYAGDIAEMIKATNPSWVIPAHGEFLHLRACAGIAKSCGVPADRVVFLEDGLGASFEKGKAETFKFDVGTVWTNDANPIPMPVLSQRMLMARSGIVAMVDGRPHFFGVHPDVEKKILATMRKRGMPKGQDGLDAILSMAVRHQSQMPFGQYVSGVSVTVRRKQENKGKPTAKSRKAA